MSLIKRICKSRDSINSLSTVHFAEQWRWRGSKSRERGERPGRADLAVTHDAASGSEEEEWQWFAVVRRKTMATIVFPFCVEAQICSFPFFPFVFCLCSSSCAFSCPPPLYFCFVLSPLFSSSIFCFFLSVFLSFFQYFSFPSPSFHICLSLFFTSSFSSCFSLVPSCFSALRIPLLCFCFFPKNPHCLLLSPPLFVFWFSPYIYRRLEWPPWPAQAQGTVAGAWLAFLFHDGGRVRGYGLCQGRERERESGVARERNFPYL